MNFWHHSAFVLLFALFLIDICVYNQIVISQRHIRSQNHIRQKRVWNGTEIKDEKFPYIVFLKTVYWKDYFCQEKLCTGTLIHPRFVLTTYSCINTSVEIEINNNITVGSNIKIFSFTRPYDIHMNTNFNIGSDVEMVHNADSYDVDDIALVLMNDTFPEINIFPTILSLDPIPRGTSIECTTAGFSLVGTHLKHPIPERIKPMYYEFKAEFSLKKCVSNNWTENTEMDTKYANAYLCYTGPKPLQSTLCEPGDTGSPLLCKPHNVLSDSDNMKYIDKRKKKSVTFSSKWDNDGGGGGAGAGVRNDGLSLYGIGVLPDINNCKSASSTKNIMFLYMLKYGAWIRAVLNDFDKHEKVEIKTDDGDEVTTKATTTTESMFVPLPDYYDTNLYDDTSKRPIRCKHPGRTNWFTSRPNKADRNDGGLATALVLWSLLVIAVTVSI